MEFSGSNIKILKKVIIFFEKKAFLYISGNGNHGIKFLMFQDIELSLFPRRSIPSSKIKKKQTHSWKVPYISGIEIF